MPWGDIKAAWETEWDLSRPILREKIPPNLLRALAIEDVSEPAHIIVRIRNPYAFCEGVRRRDNDLDLIGAAKLWITGAEHQVRGIEQLQRVTWCAYEQLTEHPESVLTQMREFMPALGSLSATPTPSRSSVGNDGSTTSIRSRLPLCWKVIWPPSTGYFAHTGSCCVSSGTSSSNLCL